MAIELWFYEVRDQATGRWRKSPCRLTEQQVLDRYGTEARKIEWSREFRDGDPEANSTSVFQRNSRGSSP